MQKQTEKQQLEHLLIKIEELESIAHKLQFDGNGFVLEDRVAGEKMLDEFSF